MSDNQNEEFTTPTEETILEPIDANGEPTKNGKIQGKDEAVISLILGISAAVILFTGYGMLLALILAIVGMVYASKAKKLGYVGTERTIGFIANLIVVIIIAAALAVVISCAGCLGCMGCSSLSGIPALIASAKAG